MVEQIEQIEKSLGNTENKALRSKASKKEQQPQYTYWFFTLNNYTLEQIEQIEQVFCHECKWYLFQEETGESGTPHLQGCVCLIKKQRMSQLKIWEPQIHWEPTHNVKASIVYCTKMASRTGKIYSYNVKLPQIEKPLKLLKEEDFYPWQRHIFKSINEEPSDRKIIWIWETIGNVGKSSFAKLLCARHSALICSGKGADCKYNIVKYHQKNGVYPELIIFDIPRSNLGYVSWTAIEEIKNGLFCSSKYESDMVIMNSPHVICFANDEPDYDKVSLDRWEVYEIFDNKDICASATLKVALTGKPPSTA